MSVHSENTLIIRKAHPTLSHSVQSLQWKLYENAEGTQAIDLHYVLRQDLVKIHAHAQHAYLELTGSSVQQMHSFF